eukprot:1555075-Rhodomonas_salina.1
MFSPLQTVTLLSACFPGLQVSSAPQAPGLQVWSNCLANLKGEAKQQQLCSDRSSLSSHPRLCLHVLSGERHSKQLSRLSQGGTRAGRRKEGGGMREEEGGEEP